MPTNLRLAYVLLWFPLCTETFIFKEIVQLHKLGVPLQVYTLYGRALRGCSEEMLTYKGAVRRMGVSVLFATLRAFVRALWQRPTLVKKLVKEICLRRLRNLEAFCENAWCFLAGFLLAEYCRLDRINLLHAPWANGSATAAWVASQLTGIPFTFAGRAGDIYPEDGLLREKIRDAVAVRTNNAANVQWLALFAPPEQQSKIHLIYNGLTFADAEVNKQQVPSIKTSTYRLLAVGRLVPKKGFADLFTALARLKREHFPVHLTLIGNGYLWLYLQLLRKRLNLTDTIEMFGFVPHDKLRTLFADHDLLVVPSIVQNANGNRDGIPNVIMEAFSMRLPVVATDVCGIGEVVRNGETGLLVPPHQPAQLAKALRTLLENRQQAVQMASAGHALVQTMFDNQHNTEQLYQLYLSALSNAGGGD